MVSASFRDCHLDTITRLAAHDRIEYLDVGTFARTTGISRGRAEDALSMADDRGVAQALGDGLYRLTD